MVKKLPGQFPPLECDSMTMAIPFGYHGKEIDWAADGALKNGEVVGQAPAPTAPSTTGAAPSPPVIVHGAFNAEEVLGASDVATIPPHLDITETCFET